MNRVSQRNIAILLLASAVLIGCSSESDDSVVTGQATTDPVDIEPAADLVEYRLASFADTNLGPIRSFPTDRTPILSLSKDSDDGAEFAQIGTGTVSSLCTGLVFEYRYAQNPNARRNRLSIDNVDDIALPDGAGCDPGDAMFESAAYDVALPLFASPGSLQSELSETLLTLYGPERGVLSFQLTEPPARAIAALSLAMSRWTILAYRFGVSAVTPAPASDPLTIRFNNDGTLVGNLQCESLSGTFALQDSTVNFNNVSFTPGSCESEADNSFGESSSQLRDAVTLVMSGPAYGVQQGSRLFLSANNVTLVLEGREALNNERRLSASVLANGEYPIPDATNGPRDVRLIQTVRDIDEFNALWNEAMAQGNDLGPPPEIDFEQSVIVYLQLGLRPHLGESMAIRSAISNDERVLIEVDTRLSDNDVPFIDGCGYDDALANPFHFVLVSDSTSLPEVVTVIDHQSSSCSGL